MSLLTSIVLILAAAAAPEVDVRVTVEPSVIPFHRQAEYTIEVEAPADSKVSFPEMAGKFGGLAVYGSPERTREELPRGRARIRETYMLDPIFMGYYPIAPAVVKVNDGQEFAVPSPAIRVRDLTPEELVEAERFEENAGPAELPSPWLQPWIWGTAGGVVIAVAVLAAVVLFVKRLRRPHVEPLRPPWEIAYDRLRELDAQRYPEKGEFQTFYVELSTVLRVYIEGRFRIHAPEQTTPEFLSEAARSGVLTEAQQRRLGRFLRHCDRVKFAQYEPTVEEMEQSFTLVLKFIDETIPVEEQGPAPEEEAA
ncbi:MAG TPA: hypothetical protein PLM14_07270 [Candidatus Hydrogenedentes bacterium]|nr:hypothetical protein [Candidatus Hydrogenedentota bacterium]HQE82787.1 hypothetical protein [Candidatus Hydrogenedentota bacterium]HQH52485.1 hypothetical protein [Candidatus Hydrogenedentota bacterium]HQM47915.1 hypothetical protein [Candidatus Hydrogenedentota bacterium]